MLQNRSLQKKVYCLPISSVHNEVLTVNEDEFLRTLVRDVEKVIRIPHVNVQAFEVLIDVIWAIADTLTDARNNRNFQVFKLGRAVFPLNGKVGAIHTKKFIKISSVL